MGTRGTVLDTPLNSGYESQLDGVRDTVGYVWVQQDRQEIQWDSPWGHSGVDRALRGLT